MDEVNPAGVTKKESRLRFLFYLLLLNQVYATFEELIERLTLQHAILQ